MILILSGEEALVQQILHVRLVKELKQYLAETQILQGRFKQTPLSIQN